MLFKSIGIFMNGWRKKFFLFLVFSAILLLVAFQFSEVEARYWRSEDGQMLRGGVYPSRAYDINESGEAVGYSNNTEWYQKAVKWTANGKMVDLGFLPGTNMSVAQGINNRGDVVGYCGQYITLLGGGVVPMNFRATLWTAEGEIIYLGTLPGAESMAVEINNHGEIVGYTYIRWIETYQGYDGEMRQSSVRSAYHAFYWDAMVGIRDLGAFAGGNSSTAYDINDRGQIVGSASNGTGRQGFSHAAMWTKDGVIKDLGVLDGGEYSAARGINELGQVVGYGYGSDATIQAFLWTAKEGMKPLETLPNHVSMAMGINNRGDIVGYSYLQNSWRAVWNASLWTPRGELVMLEPVPGHMAGQALNINNRGQIVGASYAPEPFYYESGDAAIWYKHPF